MYNKTLIFLDIDEVVAFQGQLNQGLINNLNILIAKIGQPVEVVFNTSWNVKPLAEVKALFLEGGFWYGNCLVGQTDSTRGGGPPIRDWFKANPDQIGCPYLCIDDSTREYGFQWGRLVRCENTEGFTEARVEEALAILARPLEQEQEACIVALAREANRLMTRTPWLKTEQRVEYTEEHIKVMREVWADRKFLQTAFMKKSVG